jgi:hypothetical protein
VCQVSSLEEAAGWRGVAWRALGCVSAGVSAVVFGVRLRHLGWPAGKSSGGLRAVFLSGWGVCVSGVGWFHWRDRQ